MASIAFILLCIPVLFITRAAFNYVRTFYAGLQFSKTTPLPTVTVYVHHLNVFLFLFSPFLAPIFSRLPYRFSRWFQYTRNDSAFHWRNHNLPRSELGSDVYFQISPGGNGGGGKGGVTLKVGNPAVAGEIIRRGRDFPKASYVYDAARLMGDNVIAASGDTFNFHRRVTGPPFNEANNNAVFNAAIGLAEQMMSTFEERGGQVDDLIHWTGRFALHVLTAAGFNIHMPWRDSDVDEDTNTGNKDAIPRNGGVDDSDIEVHPGEFRRAVETTLDGINWMVIFPRWLMHYIPSSWIRTTAKGADAFEKALLKLVYKATSQNEKGITGSDLLSSMLRLRKEIDEEEAISAASKDLKGKGARKVTFSNQEIIGNTFMFIIAGHETTATALGSCICHLALNPKLQHEVQTEIDNIWSQKAPNEHQLQYNADFPRMRLITAIILENLRLYPAVGTILKLTSDSPQKLQYKDTTFSVPPLTHVDLDVFSLQRNPEYWSPNPNSFNPHRWLKEPGYVPPKGSINPAKDQSNLLCPPQGAFIAFSDGVRSCLGRKFAHVEMAAALATIFRDYSVEVASVDKDETVEQAKKHLRDKMDDRTSTMAFCFNQKMPVKFVRRAKVVRV